MTPELFMLEAIKQPIIYADTDCARTACKWVHAKTGKDPMEGLLENYSREWAGETLKKTPIAKFALRFMKKKGFKRTDSPKTGDVGVIFTGAGVSSVAILGDGFWMWRNDEGGMSAVGRDAVKYIAWSV